MPIWSHRIALCGIVAIGGGFNSKFSGFSLVFGTTSSCMDHRGIPQHPARICTLEQYDGAVCWGAAYCMQGEAEKEKVAMEWQNAEVVVKLGLQIVPLYKSSSFLCHEDESVIEPTNEVRKVLGIVRGLSKEKKLLYSYVTLKSHMASSSTLKLQPVPEAVGMDY
ncbi:uncharacterized protein LOC111398212 [Olea europaea var. sylvestris]|uniref:uncharacterized protein LOC111398212 n=1 Tax=Olea europaea var. sylvestris TaxID=158386 RepID=UPI000C1D4679|nr:uncharacterized protein LOC111398212 [Olea europaea var. sylvestris]